MKIRTIVLSEKKKEEKRKRKKKSLTIEIWDCVWNPSQEEIVKYKVPKNEGKVKIKHPMRLKNVEL